MTGGSGFAGYGAYASSSAGGITVNAGNLVLNTGTAAVLCNGGSFTYNPTPSNYIQLGGVKYFAGGFPKARLAAGV